MLNKKEQIILGIDPGYGRMGIAIIEKSRGGEKLIYSECFETSDKLPHSKRLLLIRDKIEEVCNEFNPEKLAIETLLFSKNVKTALKVAEARGVIIATAARAEVKIFEYNPNQVKLAVTGYGKSDKKQVISMVEMLLKLPKKKRHDDEYDAIAIALTSSAMALSTEEAS